MAKGKFVPFTKKGSGGGAVKSSPSKPPTDNTESMSDDDGDEMGETSKPFPSKLRAKSRPKFRGGKSSGR